MIISTSAVVRDRGGHRGVDRPPSLRRPGAEERRHCDRTTRGETGDPSSPVRDGDPK